MVYFNPATILLPMSVDSNGSKLNKDIADAFSQATIMQLQRKFFNDTIGLQSVMNLCAPEFSSVEVHIRQKQYR